MPMMVSTRMRARAAGPCRGARSSGTRPASMRVSSTSWEACQNSRYGLMVVPKIADHHLPERALGSDRAATAGPAAPGPRARGSCTAPRNRRTATASATSGCARSARSRRGSARRSGPTPNSSDASRPAGSAGRSRRVAAAMAPKSAPMLMVLASTSSAAAPFRHRARVVAAQVRGQAPAGGAADAGADRLDHDHERKGDEQRPAELEAEACAGLGVGGDAARVVVGGAGDEPGPEHRAQPRRARAAAAVTVVGVSG